MGYRVDVTIKGEQFATLNYATDTDAIGIVKSVAMAFENSADDEFPVTVTEIRITLNPEADYEIPRTGIRAPGTFSISDAKNDAGEWTMSPEQIRAEMAASADAPDFDYDDSDDESECEGHESTSGPIGNVIYCDGSCNGGK